jgi:hypothetical protein
MLLHHGALECGLLTIAKTSHEQIEAHGGGLVVLIAKDL